MQVKCGHGMSAEDLRSKHLKKVIKEVSVVSVMKMCMKPLACEERVKNWTVEWWKMVKK